MLALGFGAVHQRLDMQAALAMAEAHGCPPPLAAELLSEIQAGISIARSAKREGGGA